MKGREKKDKNKKKGLKISEKRERKKKMGKGGNGIKKGKGEKGKKKGKRKQKKRSRIKNRRIKKERGRGKKGGEGPIGKESSISLALQGLLFPFYHPARLHLSLPSELSPERTVSPEISRLHPFARTLSYSLLAQLQRVQISINSRVSIQSSRGL